MQASKLISSAGGELKPSPVQQQLQQREDPSRQQQTNTSTCRPNPESIVVDDDVVVVTQVLVRNKIPPSPEMLAKLACRCWIIDLPGVLPQDLQVSVDSRDYVRVFGTRSIGRKKSFKKRFALNNNSNSNSNNNSKMAVVPHMVSAYLCSGVLVVVAPTILAASMAAATMLATVLVEDPHKYSYCWETATIKPLLMIEAEKQDAPQDDNANVQTHLSIVDGNTKGKQKTLTSTGSRGSVNSSTDVLILDETSHAATDTDTVTPVADEVTSTVKNDSKLGEKAVSNTANEISCPEEGSNPTTLAFDSNSSSPKKEAPKPVIAAPFGPVPIIPSSSAFQPYVAHKIVLIQTPNNSPAAAAATVATAATDTDTISTNNVNLSNIVPVVKPSSGYQETSFESIDVDTSFAAQIRERLPDSNKISNECYDDDGGLSDIPEESDETHETISSFPSYNDSNNEKKDDDADKSTRWTDDSLRDEPSVNLGQYPTIGEEKQDKEDDLLLQTSMQNQHRFYYYNGKGESHDNSNHAAGEEDNNNDPAVEVSTTVTSNFFGRPVTWVHVDDTWHDEDTSQISTWSQVRNPTANASTSENSASTSTTNNKGTTTNTNTNTNNTINQVSSSQAASLKRSIAQKTLDQLSMPFMPAEDELLQNHGQQQHDRIGHRQGHDGKELEPHSSWQSAPFRPSQENILESSTTLQSTTTAALARRRLNQRQHQHEKNLSLIRRAPKQMDRAPTKGITKRVTWVDEI